MLRHMLAFLIVSLSASLALSNVLHPDLENKLNSSADNELIRFMITMEVQGDFDWLITATNGLDKVEARELVVTYLKDLTERTQQEVKAYLNSYESSGQVQGLPDFLLQYTCSAEYHHSCRHDLQIAEGFEWQRLQVYHHRRRDNRGRSNQCAGDCRSGTARQGLEYRAGYDHEDGHPDYRDKFCCQRRWIPHQGRQRSRIR